MGLFSASDKGGALAAIFQSATKKEALEPRVSEPAAAASVDSAVEEIEADSASEVESEAESEQEARPAKKARNDEDNLEEQYFRKLLGAEKPDQAAKGAEAAPKAAKASEAKDAKAADTSKDDRTVFVGNVSSRVVSDRQVAKQFKQLFSQIGPVESVRFRSIAFSEQLPRRAAYIKQKVHEKRDSVNAYVVFKSAATSVKAGELNGAVFDEHHLRVDHVANPAEHNRKRSVFVGNVDFEATEEALYRHFMGCGAIEYVRIVRDSKTNFGKGFAYVQFQDAATVPAALLLNDKEMDGRKLRVTPSKQHTAKPSAAKAPARRVGKSNKVARPRVEPGEVLEGARAKTGEKVGLGRKRKARTADAPRRKRAARK